MKKLFLKNILVVLPLAAALLAACEEPQPIPDPTPSAADSLTVDLSDIRSLNAVDIIAPELRGAVSKSQDGTLMLSFAGERGAATIEAMKDYDGAAPVRRYCNYPISYTFDMGARPMASGDSLVIADRTIDLGTRSKGTTLYLSGLPAGLTSLKGVTLTEESCIDVTLSMVSPWFTDGVITPTFSVDMRRFFGAREAEAGILTFDAPLSKKNGWTTTKTFHLTDVVFDPENFDAKGQKLKLDAAIGLSGTVALSGLHTTAEKEAAAPANLQMTVTVILHDVAVADVKGTFSFSGTSDAYALSMPGLAVKGTQLLDLTSAQVTVEAIGSVPGPCDVSSSLDAHMERRSVAKASGLLFEFPASPASGKSESWGDFGRASSGEMETLLSKDFNNILFQTSVSLDPDAVMTIPIGESYDVLLTPLIEFPVRPKAGYVVDIRDTIPVPQNVVNALKEGEVRFVGSLMNSLPLDLNVEMQGFSATGAPLLSLALPTVSAGTSVPVDITVKNTVGTSIENLAMLVLSINGTFGEGDNTLIDGSCLKADLSFVIHK